MANLIEKYPVPLILKKILKDQLSGLLEIVGLGFNKKLYFFSGILQYATSTVESDRLGEVLYGEGRLTTEQLIMLRKMRQDSVEKFGKILVQYHILSKPELFEALQMQICAIGISMFSLYSGQWSFIEGAPLPEGAQRFGVNLSRLIIGGTPMNMNYLYYKGRFNFRSPVVLPIPEELGQMLPSDDIKFYVKLTKYPYMSSEQVMAIFNIPEEQFWPQIVRLYLFSVIDFAEFRLDPELNKQIEQIRDLHTKLTSHAINHYDLLQLKNTATVNEVRKKYFSFTKKYDPEAIDAPPDSEAREMTDFVIRQASVAYETLSHEEKKKAYDTGQFEKPAPPQTAKTGDNLKEERSQKARMLYLKAHDLYKGKKYIEAVRYLDEAVKLDANRSNYILLLGLAQSRIPSLRPYAEKNFRMVAEMEPSNADPLFYLGQLYWSENLSKKAENYFRQALAINMEHALAQKMIRHIEDMSKKHKPFFSIFGKKE